jgi:hypothetical protein
LSAPHKMKREKKGKKKKKKFTNRLLTAGTAEVKKVRDSVRRHGRWRADVQEAQQVILVADEAIVIVVGKDGSVTGRPGTGHLGEREAGVLERFVGRLELHAVLRIDSRRQVARVAKEGGVKASHVLLEKMRALDACRAKLVLVGMVGALGVPPRERRLGPGVAPLGHHLPEAFGVISVAGELAAQADNGDGLGGPFFRARGAVAVSGVFHCVDRTKNHRAKTRCLKSKRQRDKAEVGVRLDEEAKLSCTSASLYAKQFS